MSRATMTAGLAILAALGVGIVGGVALGTAPDRSDTPPIPRCASDDWNASHVDRCWTEGPAGVIVLDQDDRVVSTGGDE